MSFYNIHRDTIAAFRALEKIVMGLLSRGESLETLCEKSDLLAQDAIVYAERAERARQQILSENRLHQAHRRMVLFRSFVLLIACAALGGIGFIKFVSSNNE